MSKTRGAILGLLVALPILIIFYKKKLGFIISAISTIVIAAVVIVVFSGGSSNIRLLKNNDANELHVSFNTWGHDYISSKWCVKKTQQQTYTL